MDRRRFVKSVGAATTAAVVIPTVIPGCSMGKGSRKAPSDRVEMVVVGAGGMGQGNLREFLKNPAVQVVAVCDTDKTRRETVQAGLWKAYGNKDCQVFNSHEDVLDKLTFHAASIAVPDQSHALIYRDFAEAKIDIYGEKPLVRKLDEAAKVVDAVRDNKIVWQTGSWQRSVEHFHKACELMRNNVLGDIQRVEIGLPDFDKKVGMPPIQTVPEGVDFDRWTGPAKFKDYRGVMHWDWRWIMEYSGGQLTDWCGHHVDIALWGLGIEESGPKEVTGTATRVEGDYYDVPHEFKFDLKFSNDIPITLANKSNLPKGMGTTWYGTNGWIHVDRKGMTCSSPEIENATFTNGYKLYKSLNHRDNFIDCVFSRETPVAPVDAASRAIVTGLLGEIAYLTDEKILWDEKGRKLINPSDKAKDIAAPNQRAQYKL